MKTSLTLLFFCSLGRMAALGADPHWVDDTVIEQAKRAVVTIERIGVGNNFTGFFASEDGLVVALAKEIEGIKEVAIQTSAGERIVESKLVVLDRKLDLAVFATGKRPTAWLAVPDKPVAVGETCAVLFPLNDQIMAADGVLLALRDLLNRSSTGFLEGWSVALNDASAARTAAPVITGDGQVAGILLKYRIKAGHPPQKFAFAVPGTAIAFALAQARKGQEALEFPSITGSAHDLLAAANPDFIEGLKLMSTGDAAGAVLKLRSVHAQHPQSAQVLEHLAAALLAMDDFAGARSTVEEAIHMAPERLNLRTMLGTIIGRQGDIAMTTKYFAAMTEEIPKHGEGWEGLGTSHWIADRKEEAAAAYKKWTELEPDSILAWQEYSTALSGTGNATEARKARDHADELEHLYFKLKYSAPHRD